MDALASALDVVKVAVKCHPNIALLAALITGHRILQRLTRKQRSSILPRLRERVLIVGASSGIGRAIAHEYASRGSSVCVVGRREHQLNVVAEECAKLLPNQTAEDSSDKSRRILRIKADFNSVEDMVALRDQLEREWGGLDTLIVSAGVSALRPLLEVAGLERRDGAFYPPHADVEGVKHAVSAATAAMQSNYIGPLICVTTFIPLLSSTSPSPSVLLVSSLAAVVPAPTRSIYASTKGASLLLYQSLAIEHPYIAFTHIMPSSVEGDFRASAVDGGKVREADPNKHGLKREAVAKRCLEAIENGEKAVFMPVIMGRIAHFGYWLFPSLIERFAARKYKYVPA
ncbi:NAD-P-binding protein [Trametes coccinea BRFM310]|uniref:NAD-P-binding protein n=1 Tax=Trametes coccinea (strain BRFM310) TaxID=1353009 RepID=A0A1Y2J2G3_TRAC3|nr:NAD-P-binding protein [Trametes coccinea BRFM310]